ncbi:unnamed protein product [Ilex paraguariensis]|uniref:Protein kinase domain-containing protein n=1 Tax=Ilex paraguariensis TaxID=185542 RepID=A0ABC8R8E3_9AQUA
MKQFVAARRKSNVYCVIIEYLLEGSLRAFLHKLEQKSLPLQELTTLALDIACGMEYIHSQGVFHMNLISENILINQEFQLKIADFGIACEEVYRDLLADDPGNYRWMPPEMIKRVGRDLLHSSREPLDMNLRPVFPRDCPPAMGALIEKCWSLKPEKRPEF